MDYISFIKQHLGKDIGSDYVQISNGRDYEVIIYDNVVYRFPKNKDKLLDMQLEKQKLDIVTQYVDIKVPQYTIINDICITYALIPGVPFDTLGIPYTDSFVENIVLFLQQLHNIPSEKFDFLTIEKEQTAAEKQEFIDFVHQLKSKVNLKLHNKVSDEVINNIHNYMDQLFFETDTSNKVFVHADIQEKNVIYDTFHDRISGVIDFTDSRLGGAELDFCHFYDTGGDLLRKIITLYKGFYDKEFFERVFFLARRGVIFEIDNDDLFDRNFAYILGQLKKYRFIQG